jgi:hypothetical protein
LGKDHRMDDPYAEGTVDDVIPDTWEPVESFPTADEIPPSDPDMWNPAPGEVPGTGGFLFPDAPDAGADEPDVPQAPPEYDSSQGPPPGFTPQEFDEYGNPLPPMPPGPVPDSWDDIPPVPSPPPGFEVVDEYGRPTGYDAYGNPVPAPEAAPSMDGPPAGYEVLDEYGRPTGYDAYGNPVPPPIQ